MDFSVLLADLRAVAEKYEGKKSEPQVSTLAYVDMFTKILRRAQKSTDNYDDQVTVLWVALNQLATIYKDLMPGSARDSLCKFIFSMCAKTILNIQWSQLDDDSDIKKNFCATLTNVNDILTPLGFPRFQLILDLMESPWTHPVLSKIMAGEDETEGGLEYIQKEDPDILKLRIEIMVKDNCEEFALNLCEWSLKHPGLENDLKIKEHQISILYSQGDYSKMQAVCSTIVCHDGIKVMSHLAKIPTNQPLCIRLAQIFLIQDWIRVDRSCCTQELLKLWIHHQYLADKDEERFLDSIWTVAKVSRNTAQIGVLIDGVKKECGDMFIQLYSELCKFAINIDKGNLEKEQEAKNWDEVASRKMAISKTCVRMAFLFKEYDFRISRICGLTAFALVPTTENLNLVNKLYWTIKNTSATSENSKINPATIYELERLLGHLRSEILNPDYSWKQLIPVCKKYKQDHDRGLLGNGIVKISEEPCADIITVECDRPKTFDESDSDSKKGSKAKVKSSKKKEEIPKDIQKAHLEKLLLQNKDLSRDKIEQILSQQFPRHVEQDFRNAPPLTVKQLDKTIDDLKQSIYLETQYRQTLEKNFPSLAPKQGGNTSQSKTDSHKVSPSTSMSKAFQQSGSARNWKSEGKSGVTAALSHPLGFNTSAKASPSSSNKGNNESSGNTPHYMSDHQQLQARMQQNQLPHPHGKSYLKSPTAAQSAQHSKQVADELFAKIQREINEHKQQPKSRTTTHPNILRPADTSQQECAKIAQYIAQLHEKQRAEKEQGRLARIRQQGYEDATRVALNTHNIPNKNQISNLLAMTMKGKVSQDELSSTGNSTISSISGVPADTVLPATYAQKSGSGQPVKKYYVAQKSDLSKLKANEAGNVNIGNSSANVKPVFSMVVSKALTSPSQKEQLLKTVAARIANQKILPKPPATVMTPTTSRQTSQSSVYQQQFSDASLVNQVVQQNNSLQQGAFIQSPNILVPSTVNTAQLHMHTNFGNVINQNQTPVLNAAGIQNLNTLANASLSMLGQVTDPQQQSVLNVSQSLQQMFMSTVTQNPSIIQQQEPILATPLYTVSQASFEPQAFMNTQIATTHVLVNQTADVLPQVQVPNIVTVPQFQQQTSEFGFENLTHPVKNPVQSVNSVSFQPSVGATEQTHSEEASQSSVQGSRQFLNAPELSPAVVQQILSSLKKTGAMAISKKQEASVKKEPRQPNTTSSQPPVSCVDSKMSLQMKLQHVLKNKNDPNVRKSLLEAAQKITQLRKEYAQTVTSQAPLNANLSAATEPSKSNLLQSSTSNLSGNIPDLPDLGSKEFQIDSILALDPGEETVMKSEQATLPNKNEVLSVSSDQEMISHLKDFLGGPSETDSHKSSHATKNVNSTYLNANRIAKERESKNLLDSQKRSENVSESPEYGKTDLFCLNCKSNFKNAIELAKHVDSQECVVTFVEAKESKFMCGICKVHFSSLIALKDHVKMACCAKESAPLPKSRLKDFEFTYVYKCSKCRFANVNKATVASHVETCTSKMLENHSDAELIVLFRCNMCGEVLPDKEATYKHVSRLCPQIKLLNTQKEVQGIYDKIVINNSVKPIPRKEGNAAVAPQTKAKVVRKEKQQTKPKSAKTTTENVAECSTKLKVKPGKLTHITADKTGPKTDNTCDKMDTPHNPTVSLDSVPVDSKRKTVKELKQTDEPTNLVSKRKSVHELKQDDQTKLDSKKIIVQKPKQIDEPAEIDLKRKSVQELKQTDEPTKLVSKRKTVHELKQDDQTKLDSRKISVQKSKQIDEPAEIDLKRKSVQELKHTDEPTKLVSKRKTVHELKQDDQTKLDSRKISVQKPKQIDEPAEIDLKRKSVQELKQKDNPTKLDSKRKTVQELKQTDGHTTLDLKGKTIKVLKQTDDPHKLDSKRKAVQELKQTDNHTTLDLKGKTVQVLKQTDDPHKLDSKRKTVQELKQTDDHTTLDLKGKTIQVLKQTDDPHILDSKRKAVQEQIDEATELDKLREQKRLSEKLYFEEFNAIEKRKKEERERIASQKAAEEKKEQTKLETEYESSQSMSSVLKAHNNQTHDRILVTFGRDLRKQRSSAEVSATKECEDKKKNETNLKVTHKVQTRRNSSKDKPLSKGNRTSNSSGDEVSSKERAVRKKQIYKKHDESSTEESDDEEQTVFSITTRSKRNKLGESNNSSGTRKRNGLREPSLLKKRKFLDEFYLEESGLKNDARKDEQKVDNSSTCPFCELTIAGGRYNYVQHIVRKHNFGYKTGRLHSCRYCSFRVATTRTGQMKVHVVKTHYKTIFAQKILKQETDCSPSKSGKKIVKSPMKIDRTAKHLKALALRKKCAENLKKIAIRRASAESGTSEHLSEIEHFNVDGQEEKSMGGRDRQSDVIEVKVPSLLNGDEKILVLTRKRSRSSSISSRSSVQEVSSIVQHIKQRRSSSLGMVRIDNDSQKSQERHAKSRRSVKDDSSSFDDESSNSEEEETKTTAIRQRRLSARIRNQRNTTKSIYDEKSAASEEEEQEEIGQRRTRSSSTQQNMKNEETTKDDDTVIKSIRKSLRVDMTIKNKQIEKSESVSKEESSNTEQTSEDELNISTSSLRSRKNAEMNKVKSEENQHKQTCQDIQHAKSINRNEKLGLNNEKKLSETLQQKNTVNGLSSTKEDVKNISVLVSPEEDFHALSCENITLASVGKMGNETQSELESEMDITQDSKYVTDDDKEHSDTNSEKQDKQLLTASNFESVFQQFLNSNTRKTSVKSVTSSEKGDSRDFIKSFQSFIARNASKASRSRASTVDKESDDTCDYDADDMLKRQTSLIEQLCLKYNVKRCSVKVQRLEASSQKEPHEMNTSPLNEIIIVEDSNDSAESLENSTTNKNKTDTSVVDVPKQVKVEISPSKTIPLIFIAHDNNTVDIVQTCESPSGESKQTPEIQRPEELDEHPALTGLSHEDPVIIDESSKESNEDKQKDLDSDFLQDVKAIDNLNELEKVSYKVSSEAEIDLDKMGNRLQQQSPSNVITIIENNPESSNDSVESATLAKDVCASVQTVCKPIMEDKVVSPTFKVESSVMCDEVETQDKTSSKSSDSVKEIVLEPFQEPQVKSSVQCEHLKDSETCGYPDASKKVSDISKGTSLSAKNEVDIYMNTKITKERQVQMETSYKPVSDMEDVDEQSSYNSSDATFDDNRETLMTTVQQAADDTVFCGLQNQNIDENSDAAKIPQEIRREMTLIECNNLVRGCETVREHDETIDTGEDVILHSANEILMKNDNDTIVHESKLTPEKKEEVLDTDDQTLCDSSDKLCQDSGEAVVCDLHLSSIETTISDSQNSDESIHLARDAMAVNSIAAASTCSVKGDDIPIESTSVQIDISRSKETHVKGLVESENTLSVIVSEQEGNEVNEKNQCIEDNTIASDVSKSSSVAPELNSYDKIMTDPSCGASEEMVIDDHEREQLDDGDSCKKDIMSEEIDMEELNEHDKSSLDMLDDQCTVSQISTSCQNKEDSQIIQTSDETSVIDERNKHVSNEVQNCHKNQDDGLQNISLDGDKENSGDQDMLMPGAMKTEDETLQKSVLSKNENPYSAHSEVTVQDKVTANKYVKEISSKEISSEEKDVSQPTKQAVMKETEASDLSFKDGEDLNTKINEDNDILKCESSIKQTDCEENLELHTDERIVETLEKSAILEQPRDYEINTMEAFKAADESEAICHEDDTEAITDIENNKSLIQDSMQHKNLNEVIPSTSISANKIPENVAASEHAEISDQICSDVKDKVHALNKHEDEINYVTEINKVKEKSLKTNATTEKVEDVNELLSSEEEMLITNEDSSVAVVDAHESHQVWPDISCRTVETKEKVESEEINVTTRTVSTIPVLSISADVENKEKEGQSVENVKISRIDEEHYISIPDVKQDDAEETMLNLAQANCIDTEQVVAETESQCLLETDTVAFSMSSYAENSEKLGAKENKILSVEIKKDRNSEGKVINQEMAVVEVQCDQVVSETLDVKEVSRIAEASSEAAEGHTMPGVRNDTKGMQSVFENNEVNKECVTYEDKAGEHTALSTTCVANNQTIPGRNIKMVDQAVFDDKTFKIDSSPSGNSDNMEHEPKSTISFDLKDQLLSEEEEAKTDQLGGSITEDQPLSENRDVIKHLSVNKAIGDKQHMSATKGDVNNQPVSADEDLKVDQTLFERVEDDQYMPVHKDVKEDQMLTDEAVSVEQSMCTNDNVEMDLNISLNKDTNTFYQIPVDKGVQGYLESENKALVQNQPESNNIALDNMFADETVKDQAMTETYCEGDLTESGSKDDEEDQLKSWNNDAKEINQMSADEDVNEDQSCAKDLIMSHHKDVEGLTIAANEAASGDQSLPETTNGIEFPPVSRNQNVEDKLKWENTDVCEIQQVSNEAVKKDQPLSANNGECNPPMSGSTDDLDQTIYVCKDVEEGKLLSANDNVLENHQTSTDEVVKGNQSLPAIKDADDLNVSLNKDFDKYQLITANEVEEEDQLLSATDGEGAPPVSGSFNGIDGQTMPESKDVKEYQLLSENSDIIEIHQLPTDEVAKMDWSSLATKADDLTMSLNTDVDEGHLITADKAFKEDQLLSVTNGKDDIEDQASNTDGVETLPMIVSKFDRDQLGAHKDVEEDQLLFEHKDPEEESISENKVNLDVEPTPAMQDVADLSMTSNENTLFKQMPINENVDDNPLSGNKEIMHNQPMSEHEDVEKDQTITDSTNGFESPSLSDEEENKKDHHTINIHQDDVDQPISIVVKEEQIPSSEPSCYTRDHDYSIGTLKHEDISCRTEEEVDTLTELTDKAEKSLHEIKDVDALSGSSSSIAYISDECSSDGIGHSVLSPEQHSQHKHNVIDDNIHPNEKQGTSDYLESGEYCTLKQSNSHDQENKDGNIFLEEQIESCSESIEEKSAIDGILKSGEKTHTIQKVSEYSDIIHILNEKDVLEEPSQISVKRTAPVETALDSKRSGLRDKPKKDYKNLSQGIPQRKDSLSEGRTEITKKSETNHIEHSDKISQDKGKHETKEISRSRSSSRSSDKSQNTVPKNKIPASPARETNLKLKDQMEKMRTRHKSEDRASAKSSTVVSTVKETPQSLPNSPKSITTSSSNEETKGVVLRSPKSSIALTRTVSPNRTRTQVIASSLKKVGEKPVIRKAKLTHDLESLLPAKRQKIVSRPLMYNRRAKQIIVKKKIEEESQEEDEEEVKIASEAFLRRMKAVRRRSSGPAYESDFGFDIESKEGTVNESKDRKMQDSSKEVKNVNLNKLPEKDSSINKASSCVSSPPVGFKMRTRHSHEPSISPEKATLSTMTLKLSKEHDSNIAKVLDDSQSAKSGSIKKYTSRRSRDREPRTTPNVQSVHEPVEKKPKLSEGKHLTDGKTSDNTVLGNAKVKSFRQLHKAEKPFEWDSSPTRELRNSSEASKKHDAKKKAESVVVTKSSISKDNKVSNVEKIRDHMKKEPAASKNTIAEDSKVGGKREITSKVQKHSVVDKKKDAQGSHVQHKPQVSTGKTAEKRKRARSTDSKRSRSRSKSQDVCDGKINNAKIQKKTSTPKPKSEKAENKQIKPKVKQKDSDASEKKKTAKKKDAKDIRQEETNDTLKLDGTSGSPGKVSPATSCDSCMSHKDTSCWKCSQFTPTKHSPTLPRHTILDSKRPAVRQIVHGGIVFEIQKGCVTETEIQTQTSPQSPMMSPGKSPNSSLTLTPQRVRTRSTVTEVAVKSRQGVSSPEDVVDMCMQGQTIPSSSSNLNEYIHKTLDEIRRQRASTQQTSKWKVQKKTSRKAPKFPYSFKKRQ